MTSDTESGAEDEPAPGGEILTLLWAGTGAFLAVAAIATAFPDGAARPAAVVDVVLFVAGIVAFVAAYVRAVGRSRTEELSIAGLFFLAGGSAPRQVRFRFMAALAVQVVVALVTASIRPYTSVAFGVLVPMFGLGLAGLWGARHGTFPPRRPAVDGS